jgi:hypothetical protein
MVRFFRKRLRKKMGVTTHGGICEQLPPSGEGLLMQQLAAVAL